MAAIRLGRPDVAVAARPGGCDGRVTRTRSGVAAARAAADLLSLAAAPAFAAMAVLTGLAGAGQPAILCSVGDGGLPMNGMVTMYLLMSAFHLVPWLKLSSSDGRRSAGGGRGTESRRRHSD